MRAALFETMSTIPGVDLVRDEKDALGRRGIALARADDDPRDSGRLEIILDPRTYRYLGSKSVVIWEGDVASTEIDLTALLATAVVDKPFQRP